ncbi:S41 family peptidase [uncultured Chryseobacterium sp.]|uniref:S41 family peptidase n=1 Tax=uncultured Chryseobacterium sp. TaxID=259322 RepID=UPI0025DB42CF|nr:S41 family peptidase [uncultured Chryseobacterium sp.]
MISKYGFLFILLLIFGLPSRIGAQKAKNSRDSIALFYGELFSVMRKSYLHKNEVDWNSVEAETMRNIEKSENFKASLNEIQVLFSKIKATHCTIFKGDKRYALPADVPAREKISLQWKEKYDARPGFEVKLMDGKYGYILMPKMQVASSRPDVLRKTAQPLYDRIADVQEKYHPEGWIIDLRFNTGGHAWPMLAALYGFLGDHTVWTSLDADHKKVAEFSFSGGAYKMNSEKLFSIIPKGVSMEHVKVAVVTGLLTASSGEVTALAFKGRPGTVFIGEKTLGYLTGNGMVKLPYGFEMALTNSYDGDREGVYYERITPDLPVAAQDHFDNLLEDQNIREAIQFFSRNN